MFSWIEELWNTFKAWFLDVIADFLSWVWEFFGSIFAAILDAIATVVALIPVPSFLTGGLQQYLGGIDPAVLYFLSQSGFATGLALVGSGVVFRMLRKIFTLGQW